MLIFWLKIRILGLGSREKLVNTLKTIKKGEINMDGKRVQKYWSNEMKALLDIYKQFQILIPANGRDGSAHNGEDGRYVETLIRECLKKYLPKELEVLTGFILRPAVKTGLENRTRSKENDQASTQLDILIYNSSQYPVFQRFGDTVIVPPEGVIGVISVKKTLYENNIEDELKALKNVSKLCYTTNDEKKKIRGPFLALVAMDSFEKKTINTQNWIFNKIKEIYDKEKDCFEDLVGAIICFSKWSIFKKRPKDFSKAEYLYFKHNSSEEIHLGFQFLLTGILSVYYDNSRNGVSSPGFTAFPSGKDSDEILGEIEVKN